MSFFEVEFPCLAGLGVILLFGVIVQRGISGNTWLIPLSFAIASIVWGWQHGAVWSEFCLFPLWAVLLFFLGSELIKRLVGTPAAAFYWVCSFLIVVMKAIPGPYKCTEGTFLLIKEYNYATTTNNFDFSISENLALYYDRTAFCQYSRDGVLAAGLDRKIRRGCPTRFLAKKPENRDGACHEERYIEAVY